MESFNFAIDFNNNKVNIYKQDCGVVLSEEAVAIVSKKSNDGSVVAVGDHAIEVLDKINSNYEAIYPIVNGRIANLEVCTMLLEILLSKVKDRGFNRRYNIVFLVPCGLSPRELDAYINLGYSLSAKTVKLITKVQAISRMDAKKNKLSNMIIHVDRDYLDIAIINNHNVIKGYTIDLGFGVITDSINNYLKEVKQVEVTTDILEEIMWEMATVLPNDNIEQIYTGLDVYSQELVDFRLSSYNVLEYYTNFVSELSDIIDVIMKNLNKELLAEVRVAESVFTGSFANTTGLAKFLSNRLGISIITNKDNVDCIGLLGIGSKLNNYDDIVSMSIK